MTEAWAVQDWLKLFQLQKKTILKKCRPEPEMLMHACNLCNASTQKAGMEGSQSPGQSGLNSESYLKNFFLI
jgi:hypothetical protein